ncbi:hypothetical protein F4679DRAFT_595303 [Xylaria curta]|nr:hypothetical protein F4679DRAFT_595303 [Xylaria curta]
MLVSCRVLVCLMKSERLQRPGELERLKRAYSIPDPNATPPSAASPSQILFGNQFNEVNRTLVGLIALRWIYNDQYDNFRGTQSDPVALTRESFNWIRQVFQAGLTSDDDLIALITSIINHDLILLKAAEAGLVPSFDRLPKNDKADVLRGMRLGAEFNFGQLVHAENIPLLDIAGASGHEDWTCAKRFLQSTLRRTGTMGLRDAYDLVLGRRSWMLREKGFRHLDIADADDRALTRLLCMGGVANLSAAQLYESVWIDLEAETKTLLIADLNVDGSDQPAVLPTYAPSLMRKGVDVNGPGSTNEKRKRLRSLLRYLCRVLKLTDTHINGSVVDFWANPTVFESKDVPNGAIAQTSRNVKWR